MIFLRFNRLELSRVATFQRAATVFKFKMILRIACFQLTTQHLSQRARAVTTSEVMFKKSIFPSLRHKETFF